MNPTSPERELFSKSVLFQQAYESFAIYAAMEMDLFRHLTEDGATAGQMASQTGLNEKSLELLMNCLITAGILEKMADRYFHQLRFRETLSWRNAATREMLADCREQCRLWFEAAQRIRARGDTSDILERFNRSPEWTSQYLQRVEAKNRQHAHAFMLRLAPQIAKAARILDVGGGHGYYAKQLLESNPALEITIYDLASAIHYCAARAETDPALSRIHLVTGDARTLPYVGEFDIVLISDLLHYFTDPEKTEVLRRAHKSLVPGGLLVVSKFRLDHSGSVPRFSAFFALQKHLENPNGGYLETDDHCVRILREVGAVAIEILPLNLEKSLIIGHSAGSNLAAVPDCKTERAPTDPGHFP